MEALEAANNTLDNLYKALNALDLAKSWSIADILGGGFLMTYMKRSRVKEAQVYIDNCKASIEKFAKELHDGIANDLLGIQMRMALSNEQTSQEVTEMIQKVHHDVRSISHELMPPEFEQLSLNEILQNYAQTQAQNNRLDIRFQTVATDDSNTKLSSRISREVYRIVQEVTANILKHSTEVTHIDITLTYNPDKKCELKITDNGKQTKPIKDKSTIQGIGLRTVADRVKSIEGTIDCCSSEGNQFILTFSSKQNE